MNNVVASQVDGDASDTSTNGSFPIYKNPLWGEEGIPDEPTKTDAYFQNEKLELVYRTEKSSTGNGSAQNNLKLLNRQSQ